MLILSKIRHQKGIQVLKSLTASLGLVKNSATTRHAENWCRKLMQLTKLTQLMKSGATHLSFKLFAYSVKDFPDILLYSECWIFLLVVFSLSFQIFKQSPKILIYKKFDFIKTSSLKS